MRSVAVVAFALLGLFAAAEAANWAVIVAGSNGYYNYRHQADAWHAYQIMKKNGLEDDHIILMHYDDIANNEQNPVKNNIINKPDGPNVYGTVKDYTGEDVTPANFLAVITGDKAKAKGGKGRVLESTADDNVFIYFTDHGAPGLIAFPSSYLYAKDLMPALQSMHSKKMYKELVFYIEACESGSMFSGVLPEDIKVYGVSAANPNQSSYAYYMDQKRNTYLGDEFSIHMLEDSDAADMNKEKISDQVDNVRKLTKQSHVCEYGDKTISSEVLGNFMSAKKSYFRSALVSEDSNTPRFGAEAVDSRDVELAILTHKLNKAADAAEKKAAQAAVDACIAKREKADRRFSAILSSLVPHATLSDVLKGNDPSCDAKAVDGDCLEQNVIFTEHHCGKFDDYSLQYVKVLSHMCDSRIAPTAVLAAAKEACA